MSQLRQVSSQESYPVVTFGSLCSRFIFKRGYSARFVYRPFKVGKDTVQAPVLSCGSNVSFSEVGVVLQGAGDIPLVEVARNRDERINVGQSRSPSSNRVPRW